MPNSFSSTVYRVEQINKEIVYLKIPYSNLKLIREYEAIEILSEALPVPRLLEFWEGDDNIPGAMLLSEMKGQPITGNVSVECDRCLDLMDIPVEVREIIIAKYGVGESNDESIMFVSPEDEYIDISSFVYDLVIVSLPVRKIHPDDENGNSTCNLKQLECLKSYQKQDSIDPRWEVLNSLKDNN